MKCISVNAFLPAISVFAGAVFLHEPFSWPGLLFCAMILLGIYGVVNTPGEKEKDQGKAAETSE